MTENQSFQASDDVVSRDVAGEMVLLDLASGLYFGLDPVGSRAWERLSDGPADLVQLADLIEAEFDAPRAVIEQDMALLIEDLLEKQLLKPVPA